ncbi:MAG: hypothetical protein DI534_11260 [Leifsonia xyli]|nr:MAG: hypothetical protein DI534_11260 [Leifsonia xyli]
MVDHSYDDDYDAYVAGLPAFADRLPTLIETQYVQIPFKLLIENRGPLQAINLIVHVEARNGRLHDRFAFAPLSGPVPRRPDPYRIAAHLWNIQDIYPPRVVRHDMSFAVKPDGGPRLEIHCEDFRHNRVWELAGVATVDPHDAGPFVVDVELTAANLKGSVEASFELRFEAREVAIGELIDPSTRRLRVAFPMKAMVEAAIEREDFDFFDRGEDEEDE